MNEPKPKRGLQELMVEWLAEKPSYLLDTARKIDAENGNVLLFVPRHHGKSALRKEVAALLQRYGPRT